MSPINEDGFRSIIINELLISMMLNQAHRHLDIIIKFLVSLVPSTFSATSFMKDWSSCPDFGMVKWFSTNIPEIHSNTSREWKLSSLCFIPMMLLYASVVCEEELLLTSFYFRSTARYTVLVQSART